MKLEAVKQELEDWGEIIISTASGERYELHLGDTEFDLENRVVRLKTPESLHVIDGDSIENVEKHYGHRLDD